MMRTPLDKRTELEECVVYDVSYTTEVKTKMVFIASSAIVYAWQAVGVMWLATLPFSKRTVRSQHWGSRMFHLALAVPGFALLGAPCLREGWLGERFFAYSPKLEIVGLALTVMGCGFAVWARMKLGSNWSAAATVKADHELIMAGPYAVTRHPIYSGLLLACLGTALAEGEWRCVIGVTMIFVAFVIKIRQEEHLMMETFPVAYGQYRRRVKALIPGVF